MRIVRLFVELYIDAFGVFQKRAYSPEGVYITFGNMSRRERNKLSNILCVGMKPPHTDTTVCLSVFTADVKKLQRGFYLTVKGEVVYVIGGLDIVKAGLLRVPNISVFARPVSSSGICPANHPLLVLLSCCVSDMPQAQELAGCKHQSATKPCRMCHVTKGAELGDPTFDAKLRARTLWEVREDRQSVIANQRTAPLDIGLALSASVLEDVDLVFDHTRQLPPEPLHAELLGISLLVLDPGRKAQKSMAQRPQCSPAVPFHTLGAEASSVGIVQARATQDEC